MSGCYPDEMDAHSFDRRTIYLFLLDALVLFDRFGGDGRGAFRRVVGLNVSCGSGDGSPSLATTDTDGDCAQGECDDEGDDQTITRLRSE